MADNDKENGVTPIRKRPSGLGRGLNALFGDAAVEAPVLATPGSAARAAAVSGDAVQHVPVGAIRPLPGQPRRHFDETAIAEEHAKLKLRDAEHANRTRPRGKKRKKAKRGRPRPSPP